MAVQGGINKDKFVDRLLAVLTKTGQCCRVIGNAEDRRGLKINYWVQLMWE
jgi:hypothetical protein